MDNHDMNMGLALLGGMMMYLLLFILVVAVFFMVCRWRIYTKAGKPGWTAIIPIYNYFVLLNIVGKPWWWFLLLFIPLVNIVVAIIVVNELSKCFGKGAGFTLGLIFLSFIFYPILAFGDAQYTPPGGGVEGAGMAMA